MANLRLYHFILSSILAFPLCPLSVLAQDKKSPAIFTVQEDHRDMQKQLGITKLRPGPSGNPKDPNAANVDESKANPYPELPDVFKLKSGNIVTTAEMWWKHRRPEIVEDFEQEVIGRVPSNVPGVKWEVRETRESKAGEVETIEKHLMGLVDNSTCPEIQVQISMSLTVPKNSKEPIPVLMMFGPTPFDPLPPWLAARRGGAGGPPGPTRESQLIEAGWGIAMLNPTSFQDDAGGTRPAGPGSGGNNINQEKKRGGTYSWDYWPDEPWSTEKAG